MNFLVRLIGRRIARPMCLFCQYSEIPGSRARLLPYLSHDCEGMVLMNFG